MVAAAYDAFLPPDVVFDDDHVHTEVIRQAESPALELGVGNGRFLLPRLAEGLHVEGIDEAPDMLERCRARAAASGIEVVLHVGDMAPLALPRRYGAICATAGSFMLVADDVRARAALASYLDHLEVGGALSVSMPVPDEDADTGGGWRLRRTGTADDGTTYVAHEATHVDRASQLVTAYNRLETLDRDGRILDAVIRRALLRWWTPAQLEALLRDAGFGNVTTEGPASGSVTVARRT